MRKFQLRLFGEVIHEGEATSNVVAAGIIRYQQHYYRWYEEGSTDNLLVYKRVHVLDLDNDNVIAP